jgi:hypothetical protein
MIVGGEWLSALPPVLSLPAIIIGLTTEQPIGPHTGKRVLRRRR